jgi:hypothetical protein
MRILGVRNNPKRSAMILGVAMLRMLACSQPASATTYSFIIPTGVVGSPDPNSILGALDIAVQQAAPNNTNPLLNGFYDFYIRPQLSSDGTIANNANVAPNNTNNPLNLIADYSMATSTATAPVSDCASSCTSSAYTGTPNVMVPIGGASAHFTFNTADNTIAIVSNNFRADGQSYPTDASVNPFPNGATTEIMPSSAAFAFTLTTSTYSSYQTPKITFLIYALAVQYRNPSTNTLVALPPAYIGDFDEVGTAPEPSTIFIVGGGLCLVSLSRLLRKGKR